MSRSVTTMQTNIRYLTRNSRLDLSLAANINLVNRVYRFLGTSLPWPEFREDEDIATVAGQQNYTPSNVYIDVKVVSVTGENTETSTDDSAIVQPPPDEVRWAQEGNNDDAAWPVYYLLIGDDIYLRPAPLETGKNINVVGIVEPTSLEAADSTVFRNASSDDILELLIAAEIQFHDGYPEDAQSKIRQAISQLEQVFDKEMIPAELYAKSGN